MKSRVRYESVGSIERCGRGKKSSGRKGRRKKEGF